MRQRELETVSAIQMGWTWMMRSPGEVSVSKFGLGFSPSCAVRF